MGYIPWNEKEIQASYCTVTELKGMAVESCNVCWRLAILSRWKVNGEQIKKVWWCQSNSVCNFTNMAHGPDTVISPLESGGIGLRFTDSDLERWINCRQG